MINTETNKILFADVALRDSSLLLWELSDDIPEIRQIFGHYLPPCHKKLVTNSLVAKDFNFPPPKYGGLESYVSDSPCIADEFATGDTVSLEKSINIRAEEDGAVIYTAYANGFFANSAAYKILKCCESPISLGPISKMSGYDLSTVETFIRRALALGILSVNGS